MFRAKLRKKSKGYDKIFIFTAKKISVYFMGKFSYTDSPYTPNFAPSVRALATVKDITPSVLHGTDADVIFISFSALASTLSVTDSLVKGPLGSTLNI